MANGGQIKLIALLKISCVTLYLLVIGVVFLNTYIQPLYKLRLNNIVL